MTPTNTPTRPKRTAVTRWGDYAHAIVPDYLDYPEEIEQATEDVRAAAVNVDAARAAERDATRRLAAAGNADRIAAASASPAPVAPTAPALKSAAEEARTALQAALDAANQAVKRQHRAITPDVATDWRERLDPQVRDVSDEIRDKLRELADLVARRDNMLELDAALERVQAGEVYRLNIGSPEHAQRHLAKETEKMLRLQRDGQRSLTVPNDPPFLLAALTADADRWELRQEAKRHHTRIGEIVSEVRALNLDSAARVAEIRRRLAAEDIPVPRGIGLA